MRLWTFHPRYLDPRGLTALWREALLARAVLRGRTRGYRRHPQLLRFRNQKAPVGCVNSYLKCVFDESRKRGYRFDRSRLGRAGGDSRIETTAGQLRFEWQRFKEKLMARNRGHLAEVRRIGQPEAHPLFRIVPGPKEDWEKSGTAGRMDAGALRPGTRERSGAR